MALNRWRRGGNCHRGPPGAGGLFEISRGRGGSSGLFLPARPELAIRAKLGGLRNLAEAARWRMVQAEPVGGGRRNCPGEAALPGTDGAGAAPPPATRLNHPGTGLPTGRPCASCGGSAPGSGAGREAAGPNRFFFAGIAANLSSNARCRSAAAGLAAPRPGAASPAPRAGRGGQTAGAGHSLRARFSGGFGTMGWWAQEDGPARGPPGARPPEGGHGDGSAGHAVQEK